MYRTNHVPQRLMSESKTGCCPPFNPKDWDGQTFVFKNKRFMRFSTRSIFHIPLNMNSAMSRAMAKVSAADAEELKEPLILSEDVSMWKAYHYAAVTGNVPGAKIVDISGKFLATVFEGSYSEMGHWYKELVEESQANGKTPKVYFSYTVCPKCARSYGKNYVIGFVQVDE